jgi:Protein of unknown function (DUF2934)
VYHKRAHASQERDLALLRSKPIATQILESLARNPACEFQQLLADCSEFTWNQLFYEVDRLSQLGQLCLTSVGGGHYSMRLPSAHPNGEPRSVERVDRQTWIAQRAYQLYEAQGRRDGHALEHWLQAEREIRAH